VILTVIFVDSFRKEIALVHEDENFPYQFRTVQIQLTDEQVNQLQKKEIGKRKGIPVFEEIYNSWLENEKGER
jgi:hypothetical protein